MKGKGLTQKQKRFVDEYLKDLNATQAAIRTGYSPKVAHVNGPRLLTNAEIQSHLSSRMKARESRTEITQDRVLKELAKIGFQDVRALYNPDGSLKPIHSLDDQTAASIAGLEFSGVKGEDGQIIGQTAKVRLSDKRAALVDIGKHLGMFTDKIESTNLTQMTIIGGLPDPFADAIDSADPKPKALTEKETPDADDKAPDAS